MINSKQKKVVPEDKAMMKLAELCARSEQCESDLFAKLKRWGVSPSAASDIIEKLRKQKFVDNLRYAQAFSRDKARFSRWGKRKIRLGLMAKHIPADIIQQGLDSIDEDEYIVALNIATETKGRNMNLSDAADRRKLYAHLISRGYESGLAVAAIKRLIAKARKES